METSLIGSVLITGGSGSFGKAFVRRLLDENLSDRICVYSRGEHAQEAMAREFASIDEGRLRFFVGDIRDKDRIETAMRGIETVVHAAALKVVPICEYNPQEAVKTNILGTQNVIDAAIRADVRKVMFISTDKATAASTLYGATKFTAERMIVAANALAGRTYPKFSAVRYGNVIGSNGSIYPLFKKLVADGAKELPVTDARMTRFFWTLDDAVTFTLSSIEMMDGGEVFVPKIAARRIVDVAHEIAPHLPQKIIGVRPGEKLHELLISEDEARTVLDIGDRFVICPTTADWNSSHLRGEWVSDGFKFGSDSAIMSADLLDAAE